MESNEAYIVLMTTITAMRSSMRAFQCCKGLASGQVDRTLNTRSR